jgi:hypothetical protein
MKSWTDVAKPHDDILAGDLEMAVFAADLGSVVRREGGLREVYADPRAFFRATHLTGSMRSLLDDVLGALAGSGGDRVIQLRTPFGGGKTHSLLALYHLAVSRAQLDGIAELAGLPDPGSVRVAVLSGVDLDPSSPRTHDGVVAHTAWGELAWQLGGAEAYELVRAQDEQGQAPGKDVLARLLPVDEAALLLLDEVLVYVEKAKALQRGDSTLGAQVLLFLQALTELVGAHPRAAMVYSLQKSVLEAAGDESLLLALDHLVTRVDAKREPVTGDEVMRVVQRRLFAELGPEDERDEVARAQADLYRRYRRQLADTEEERRNADAEADRFAERIKASYPFHPALLDLMHQRWTTLPSYQRTRGALQFLATVVHGLWNSDRQALGLIGPGDVPFDDERVRGAFFSQVGDREGFTGVLERDFNGANAKAKEVDRRMGGDVPRLRNLRIGTRVASATLLYSFGGQSEDQRGVLESELVGGLIGPDLDRNLLTTALGDLREELLFLHHGGRRYWFDKKANLNQLLATEANRFSSDEVVDAVRKELERRIGPAPTALLWPQQGGQIPDEDPVFRVAYLDPSWAGIDRDTRDERLRELFERRGAGSNRAYRNAVGFALPSEDAIEHSRQAARRLLAARSLVKQAKSLNITGEQLSELKERGDAAERDLVATLDRAYELVLLPVEATEGDRPYRFEEIDLSARIGLGRVVHDRVLEGLANHVFETITPQKLGGLIGLGPEHRFVSAPKVVDAAFSYLQFPKLLSDAALRDAVARGVMKGVFGYAAMAVDRGDALEVRPELVSIGRPMGSDEADLGDGAFLVDASYARELARLPPQDETPEQPGGDSDGSSGVGESGTGDSGARKALAGTRLSLLFRVGKSELFDSMQVLATLSDESEALEVAMRVEATAKESFDQTWVRNAIRERLEEAGIDVTADLSSDSDTE